MTSGYTQFCIGVERGDVPLVRGLVQRGANPMVTYSVDGQMTTPIQSSLRRGDLAMTQALLASKTARVQLSDIQLAPRVDSSLVTPTLIQRLCECLDGPALDHFKARVVKRTAPSRGSRSKPQHVDISDAITQRIKASKKDPDPVVEYNDDEESEDDDDEESEDNDDEESEENEEEETEEVKSGDDEDDV